MRSNKDTSNIFVGIYWERVRDWENRESVRGGDWENRVRGKDWENRKRVRDWENRVRGKDWENREWEIEKIESERLRK